MVVLAVVAALGRRIDREMGGKAEDEDERRHEDRHPDADANAPDSADGVEGIAPVVSR